MDVSVAQLSGTGAAAALARLRAEGPVSWVPALDAWVVTGHALAVAVVRDDTRFTVDDPRFSTAQVVGPSMLSLDGAEHRRHRSAFAAPFRPKQVAERFGAFTEQISADLLGRIRATGRGDLRGDLAGPLSVAVMARALGLADLDAATVLGWYREIVAGVSAISAGARPGPATAAAVDDLDRHVRTSARVAGSVLVEADAALPVPDVVADAAVLMFGGIETTEAMIANLFVHLLQDAELAGVLRADPALVPAAVEESLRLEPGAAAVDRYATNDLDLGGAHIAQGDLVRVSLLAANRDPEVFADPDRFTLGRPNVRDHLAFATGPHICVAMDLARLEACTAAQAALQALPGLRLAAPVTVSGLIFRKPDAVPVVWRH